MNDNSFKELDHAGKKASNYLKRSNSVNIFSCCIYSRNLLNFDLTHSRLRE